MSDKLTEGQAALANLRAYINTASPSPAQTVAVVKIICRILIYLVRIRLGKLDAVD